MIGKCKSSGAGLSKYLLDEKKHKGVEIVERNNIFSDNAKDLNREFERQAETSNSRKKVNKYHQHIVFSHHKDDAKFALDNEKMLLEDMKDNLKKRGLDLENTQSYVVRHQEKEHLHYHIHFNKIDTQGNSIPMHNASLKCKQVSVDISKKHDLQCGKKTEIKKDISLDKKQKRGAEPQLNKSLEDEQKNIKQQREKDNKNDIQNEQTRGDNNKGQGFSM
jgi:hypothetical protein